MELIIYDEPEKPEEPKEPKPIRKRKNKHPTEEHRLKHNARINKRYDEDPAFRMMKIRKSLAYYKANRARILAKKQVERDAKRLVQKTCE